MPLAFGNRKRQRVYYTRRRLILYMRNNMKKLIGHYFDGHDEYSIFVVEGLKETTGLYVRTDETLSGAPNSFDNWKAFNKCHLGRLRPHEGGIFTMYCLREDLPHFKEKVTASLNFRQNVKIAAR